MSEIEQEIRLKHQDALKDGDVQNALMNTDDVRSFTTLDGHSELQRTDATRYRVAEVIDRWRSVWGRELGAVSVSGAQRATARQTKSGALVDQSAGEQHH